MFCAAPGTTIFRDICSRRPGESASCCLTQPAPWCCALWGKPQGCNPARIEPSQGRVVKEHCAETSAWQRREDVELVETHERQVAELEASLAEVSAAAAAAEAEDWEAQQAAVDRLNEHDMEVREPVCCIRPVRSQQPTAPDYAAATLRLYSACALTPARLFC